MRDVVSKACRFRLLILSVVALLSVVTSAAPPLQVQEPAPPATASAAQTGEPEFKLRVQKNVVIVRVVVRDSNRRAVKGLQKEDFRISDNKKPQVVSSFSVETSAAGAVAAQPWPGAPAAKAGPEAAATPVAPLTYLAFYFDDLYSAMDSICFAREAAEKFIPGLPRTERVAIFTSSGTQSLDFTDDRQKLHEALMKLRVNAGLYLGPTGGVLKNLDSVIERLAAMPGERQVILVSDGFIEFGMQNRVESVVEHALRARVTISALDSAGLSMQGSEVDASQSQMPKEALAELPKGVVVPPIVGARMDALARDTDTARTLAEIANGTGGLFSFTNNSLLRGMRKILLPPEVSYVLTFSPTELKADGTFHTLKVTLAKGHDFTIQARKGYFAPRKQVGPEELAKNEIREAVYSTYAIQDLPLTVQTEVHKAEGQNAEIAVQAKLDVRNLPFQKRGDRNVDNLTFAVALFDHDGKYVSGSQQNFALALKDTALADLEKSGLIYKAHVSVKPGAYTVRVVVRDSQGGQMAASSKAVETPP